MFIVFGNFLLPFLVLLSYRYKVTHQDHQADRLLLVLAVVFVDLCYNILPALKDPQGNPLLSSSLWRSCGRRPPVVGAGGICVWAYLRSFPTTKLIPIRDPRITECLSHHE